MTTNESWPLPDNLTPGMYTWSYTGGRVAITPDGHLLLEQTPPENPGDLRQWADHTHAYLTGDSWPVEGLIKDELPLAVRLRKIDRADSDGYHSFAELYHYRMLYNALAFNLLAAADTFDVHKSRFHFNGEPCYGGGWFVVVAQTPYGQISNHYESDHWDLFDVPERERAAEYDGHSPAEAAWRLGAVLRTGRQGFRETQPPEPPLYQRIRDAVAVMEEATHANHEHGLGYGHWHAGDLYDFSDYLESLVIVDRKRKALLDDLALEFTLHSSEDPVAVVKRVLERHDIPSRFDNDLEL